MSELKKFNASDYKVTAQKAVDEIHDMAAQAGWKSEPKEVMVSVDLNEMVKAETEKRKILTKYITDHLKEGVDYGKIGNFPKFCLLKPGSEKFISLMHLTVQFKKDDETFEMAGRPAGLFCYKAQLIDETGRIVGEGRGTCSIEEKRNPNTAVKIALKRAQMDAVLRTGGLSDFFTQDLEDMHADKTTVLSEADSNPPIEPIMVNNVFEEGYDPAQPPVCPKCGRGQLVEKNGKYGKFTACNRYPECKFIQH